MKGLEQRRVQHRIQARRLTKSKLQLIEVRRVNILHLSGDLTSAELKGIVLCRRKNQSSPGSSTVKNPPPLREMLVQSLIFKDSPGEGNGNPLQYSCLGNFFRGRGAWWATVHEVAEIQTRLSTTTTMIINDTHRHQDSSQANRNSWALKPLHMVTAAMKLKDLPQLLGRRAMTNLDSILHGRDITLPTKVCIVKAVVFPIVVYGCERWTVKKSEHQRIDAFELWCWRRFSRAPWTARSNKSVLKDIILNIHWKD